MGDYDDYCDWHADAYNDAHPVVRLVVSEINQEYWKHVDVFLVEEAP